jgi:uncharacterized membrane protein
MDTSSGYKDRALESLKGNWDKGILATIIVYALTLVPTYGISLSSGGESWGALGNLWQVAMLPLGWGLAIFFLRIARMEKVDYNHLFEGFSDFWRIFSTLFVKNVFTFLWSLLLIVPGIIKYYSYAMTDYILKDYPELGVNETIEKSMQMMQGHKMDLFLLHLSFIGWAILACFTMGLGFLFLLPYVNTSVAHFYEDLKAEQRA